MVAPTDVSREDPMLRVAQTLVSVTEARRDTWPSLEDAISKLKSRRGFAAWDDEVFRIYLVGSEHLVIYSNVDMSTCRNMVLGAFPQRLTQIKKA